MRSAAARRGRHRRDGRRWGRDPGRAGVFGGRRQPPADALDRFLAIYDTKLLDFTRPYEGIPDVLDALGARASLAVLTNKPRAATRAHSGGLRSRRFFEDEAIVGGDGPFPRKPDPAGAAAAVRSRRRGAERDDDGRRFRRRLANGAQRRNANLPGALRIRISRSFLRRNCARREIGHRSAGDLICVCPVASAFRRTATRSGCKPDATDDPLRVDPIPPAASTPRRRRSSAARDSPRTGAPRRPPCRALRPRRAVPA